MKTLQTLAFVFALAGLAGLISCGGDDEPTPQEKAIQMLTSKTSWTVNSVIVPPQTATISDDWTSFTVSFTNTTMSTSGFPTGAGDVWPSGSYTVSEDGNTITSSAAPTGWVLNIATLTETTFNSTITVPDGVEIGRVEALDGDYTFNLK